MGGTTIWVSDETKKFLDSLKTKSYDDAIKKLINSERPLNIDLTTTIPPGFRVDRAETEKMIPMDCIMDYFFYFFHPGTENSIRDFVLIHNGKEIFRLKVSADNLTDRVPLNIFAKKGDVVWFEASNVSELYSYTPIFTIILRPLVKVI